MPDHSNRFCSQCGASIRADAKFCPACGTPVQKSEIAEEARMTTPPPIPQALPPQPKKSGLGGWVTLARGLVGGVIVLAIVGKIDNPPASHPTSPAMRTTAAPGESGDDSWNNLIGELK